MWTWMGRLALLLLAHCAKQQEPRCYCTTISCVCSVPWVFFALLQNYSVGLLLFYEMHTLFKTYWAIDCVITTAQILWSSWIARGTSDQHQLTAWQWTYKWYQYGTMMNYYSWCVSISINMQTLSHMMTNPHANAQSVCACVSFASQNFNDQYRIAHNV